MQLSRKWWPFHYNDVIMRAMASQITGISIVCSTDQRKYQSSASLAFVQRTHQWLVNSTHKRPVTQKMFPFDDIMFRPQHVNRSWPSDTIWQHRSGLSLPQVMACYLMAPSHDLGQYWLIISKVKWYSSEGNFIRDTSVINHWNWLKNYLHKFSLKSLQWWLT